MTDTHVCTVKSCGVNDMARWAPDMPDYLIRADPDFSGSDTFLEVMGYRRTTEGRVVSAHDTDTAR